MEQSRPSHPPKPRSVPRQDWFRRAAKAYRANQPLHHASRWGYLSLRQWETLVLAGIRPMRPPIEDGQTVFEVGCGAGAFLKVIQKHFPAVKVGGVDLLEEAVDIARNQLPEGEFHVGDGRDLCEVAPNSFDHVIANFVIGYLIDLEAAKQFVREMVRITRPGGSLALTCLVEPEGFWIGSTHLMIPKRWWIAHNWGARITSVETMGSWDGCKSQGDRYAVYMQKGV